MDEVELTQELVRINSENPPGNEKSIAKYVFDYLNDLKVDAELVEFGENRYNVVASAGNDGGLMLNSHIDTVPVGKVENWKYDPFEARIVDGKLHGRGSCDSKGNVAVILSSLQKFSKEKFKRKLLITLVGDEEVGFGGSNYLINNRKDLFKDVKYGVVSDSDFEIKIVQKGVLHLKFVFKGKAAHGAYPELGVNAITKAAKFIAEVERLKDDLTKKNDEFLGRGSINIGKIVGGTKVNIVPSYCEVSIDRRLTHGESIEYAINQFRKILIKLKLDTKVGGDFEMLGESRVAIKTPKDSKLVKLLQSISNLKIGKLSGYTEMELYHRKLGMECIAIGVANETAHSDNEYVKIDELRKSRYIFENLIRKWCF
ncbi:MAG: M20 family metallopeptidase [Candidatus Aenigmarchaeota archaeon]|nr:M20 family metallopeptidase [Candidatus Aenigmarchaeota archaeon]